MNKDQIKGIEHTLGTLVVGRSGTGKTTCAVMRMIGYRLLEIAKRNLQNGVRKIRHEDLCDPCTFRMVFLTASPLLAKNVKHLYVKVNTFTDKGDRLLEGPSETERHSARRDTSGTEGG